MRTLTIIIVVALRLINYPQAGPLQIMTFYLVVGRLGYGSLVPHVSRYMQLSPIHVPDRAFRQQICSGICHAYNLLDHIGERRVIINWSMLATSVTRV